MRVCVNLQCRAPGWVRASRIVLFGVMAWLAGAGGHTPLSAQTPPKSDAAAPRAVPRDDSLPFSHKRHMALKCGDCHSTDNAHGQVKLKAPDDCRSCHHAASAKAGACTVCHTSNQLTRGLMKSVIMNVSARKAGPVTRNLPFKHDVHARFQCASCHEKGVTKRVENACTSCHADHHEAPRDCAACHPTATAGHDRAIHAGCTSCHSAPSVRTLSATRTTCVMCHAAQVKHYTGRECAVCHAVDLSGGSAQR